jgi:iron(III) transport system permease protein
MNAPLDFSRSTRIGQGWPTALLSASAWAVAMVLVVPLAVVAATLLLPRGDVWLHLWETLLGELVVNTALLLAGVAVGTSVLGTTLAWIVTAHRFPGRALFDRLLVLPLAMPAYVVGFVVVAQMEFAGPVQTQWRGWLGDAARLPEIKSWWGVVLTMCLVLYPYVYLLARAAFADMNASLLDAGRSLGCSSRRLLWRVAIPSARPAIATGVALALMEALADFGTVALFNFPTFTTAIYRVWFGMFDREAGSQLASLLLITALILILAERRARGRAAYTQHAGRSIDQALRPLRGIRAALAIGYCSTVVGLAFVLPVGVLLAWSAEAWQTGRIASTYPALVTTTVILATTTAVLAVAIALVLAYALRVRRQRLLARVIDVATLGYAVPGSVVAVGILVTLAWVDDRLAAAWQHLTGTMPDLLVIGSVGGLIFAYLVRFAAVARFSVEAGLARITRSLDEAARSLGARAGRVLLGIHVPLLRRSLLTAALLVFLDTMKEMPATLLIRPLGWDTLAVEIWQRTTEGLWVEAAVPALTIVAAGLLPVFVLTSLRERPLR